MSSATHAFAGALGGTAAFTITYPLINISTRQQVGGKHVGNSSSAALIRTILAEEGINGLYRGLGSGVVGIAATQGVYYYFYSALKQFFEQMNNGSLTNIQNLITGSIGGACAATATNPIWVVNTRVQTARNNDSADHTGQKTTFMDVVRQIYSENGIGGFWRGLGPALVLVSNPTIQYFVFEKLKETLARNRNVKSTKLTSSELFLLGAIGKICATFVTYPYIVTKAKLQASSSGSDESTVHLFARLIRSQGFLALYRGIQSKLIQSVLNAAFLFMFQSRIVAAVIRMSRKKATKELK